MATIPAAVAESRFSALRERRKGANDPSVTFQRMRNHTGKDTASKVPPNEVLVVKVSAVKDAIRNGDLKGVEWVDTRMQLADCLTKAMVPTYLWQVLDAGQLS